MRYPQLRIGKKVIAKEESRFSHLGIGIIAQFNTAVATVQYEGDILQVIPIHLLLPVAPLEPKEKINISLSELFEGIDLKSLAEPTKKEI